MRKSQPKQTALLKTPHFALLILSIEYGRRSMSGTFMLLGTTLVHVWMNPYLCTPIIWNPTIPYLLTCCLFALLSDVFAHKCLSVIWITAFLSLIVTDKILNTNNFSYTNSLGMLCYGQWAQRCIVCIATFENPFPRPASLLLRAKGSLVPDVRAQRCLCVRSEVSDCPPANQYV